MAVTEIVDGKINDRWDIRLPDFRAQFHADRPKWEAGRLEHMAEVVQPGWTIFDVGAEHGDFTALYKLWVRPHGVIVPVEPSTAYWPCVQATWEANYWSQAPEAAFVGFASDRGEARFGLYQGEWPTECAGEVRADPGFRHLISGYDTISQIRLDELAMRTGLQPNAIVMDIEGAEWQALRGLARVVRPYTNFPPHVWVSVHEPTMATWYGTCLEDILDLMLRLFRYGIHKVLPAHGEGETFHYFAP